LGEADLRKANLSHAELSWADLFHADMRGADMRGTNLNVTSFDGTSLQEAKYLTIEQLSEVNTLYKAKLDPAIMEQIKEKYPHLLEKPKPEKEKQSEDSKKEGKGL
jgi:uncharacterized protein YjbI with pentapeptide repeats